MNIETKIENIKDVCTNSTGELDKDVFRVRIAMLPMEYLSKGIDITDYYSVLNKCICNILGSGHSFASCVQFMGGKQGIATIMRAKQHFFADMSPELISKLLSEQK